MCEEFIQKEPENSLLAWGPDKKLLMLVSDG
ncbi:hypothetical protein AT05_03860 [Schleiferia thermophila str. Yellowstone]|nr:hypothetical protein AT05_03860 [Schleiferia thermophila str. Yellowstone]